MPVIWPRQSARRLMGVYNVREEPYGARPSESAATNVTAIQRAVDDANTAGGGVVLLPEAGTYNIDNYVTAKSRVTLAGASRATVLALNSASSIYTVYCPAPSVLSAALTADAAEGDQKVKIGAAAIASLALTAGTMVYIYRSTGGWSQWCMVETVDGDYVWLTSPLYNGYTVAQTSYLYKPVSPVTDFSLEDITLDGSNALAASGHGVSLDLTVRTRFRNVHARGYNGSGLRLNGSYGAEIIDCSTYDSGSGGNADLELIYSTAWSVDNFRSDIAKGFGPHYFYATGGRANNVGVFGAQGRSTKLNYSSYNLFANYRIENGRSTGFSITQNSHHNDVMGLHILGTDMNGGIGGNLWIEGGANPCHHNTVRQFVSLYNEVRSMSIDAGSYDNVVEGWWVDDGNSAPVISGNNNRIWNYQKPRDPKNLLRNGDFAVAQLGDGPFTSATAYPNTDALIHIDGWRTLYRLADAVDVSVVRTGLPTGARGAIALDVETVDLKFGICQVIETKDTLPLRSSYVSLSFKVKTSGASITRLRVGVIEWTGTADGMAADPVNVWNNSGSNPSLITGWAYLNTPADLTLTNSWQTFYVPSVPVGANANNLGVFLWIDNADLNGTDGADVGDFLYLTDICLVPGNSCPPDSVLRASIEDEMGRNQRFRQVLGGTRQYEVVGMGYNRTTTVADFAIALPVKMRTTPSLTFGSQSSFAVTHGSSETATTAMADGVTTLTNQNAVSVRATVAAGLTAGGGSHLRSGSTTDGWILVSADL